MNGKFESIETLLLQIEEGKKIQENLNQKINEKYQACERLEGETVFLGKEIEKAKTQLNFNEKFGQGIKILN